MTEDNTVGSLSEAQRSVIIGSLFGDGRNALFDLKSQERLLSMLKEQWGIDATLNRDKTYYRIRIAVRSVDRLRDIIGPHLLPQLAYKLPA